MKKKFLYITGSVFLVIVILSTIIFNLIFCPKIKVEGKKHTLYLPTGSTYEQVFDTITRNLDVKNNRILRIVAEAKNYQAMIRPGKYVIDKNISYNKLINILRSGQQTTVLVTFNNVRTIEQIAGKISHQLEADSAKISAFFSDESNYKNDGFNKADIISVFIPNTYEFYWNTNPKKLYSRMLREYNMFWDTKRIEAAKEKGLTPKEVAILASIIDDEVAKPDEKPRIAGVYLNRLQRGIPLQACPTIKFAMNDFTITRILYKYLQIDSPYNTYIHKGFPPGPIGCPSIEGLNAVLNAEKHDYLFFAAKSDFSGYHNFSKTLTQHNRFANEYQLELDRRKIFK